MLRLAAIALLIGLSTAGCAQTHICPEQEARQAEEATDALGSWDRVYEWYKKYRQCDDGGVSEGVSEAVARNLVDRWETLSRLGELAKEVGFRRFVVKHLDDTLNADDLKKISANASKRCPTSLVSLCRELKKQADGP